MIGVFDSGLGGLSVWQHIRQLLPAESLYYVADSANAPYGSRDNAFIQQRSLAITRFLVEAGAAAIVVACNTATAASVSMLRQEFSCPIVAMEPALKPAVLKSESGRVGILATESTLASKQYHDLVSRFAAGVECFEQPAHGLVECVEQGQLNDESTIRLLQEYLQPMMARHIDSLVLGCTHYPFLMAPIKQICGEDIEVIDTGAAVAQQLKRVLEERHLLQASSQPELRFFSSAETENAQQRVKQLLGIDVVVEKFRL